ncbi:hypothetical protein [uncultured Roseobacter sp.]|uniref:hypothetical protein n=1 Tax=uncultured Roseobacter sp. TaxID=114847 RepID=UPI00260558C4|nr:hypothetical protein [uncultured Roseobacter sp.]
MRGLTCGIRCGLAGLLALLGPAVLADVQARQADALARIKAATEQRTLLQTMAKSTCYLMAGVAPQLQAEQAFIASMMFDDNTAALRDGQVEGLTEEDIDAQILSELDRIDQVWRTLAPATRQVMSGDFHAVPVQQLITLTPVAAAHLDALVVRVAEVYYARMVTRGELISTITHATGQSMLMRKAIKEFCYVGIDLMRDEMRGGLGQSIEAFERILDAMETGDFDLEIVDPPGLAALGQMMEIRNVWTDLRPLLERGLQEAPIGPEMLAEVAKMGDEMVALTDGMVLLYLQ